MTGATPPPKDPPPPGDPPSAGRAVLGGLAGLLAGFFVVAGLEAAGHALWPPPPDLLLNDPIRIAEAFERVPLASLVAVVVAQTAGAFVAGLVGAAVGRRRLAGHVPGALLVIATLLNLAMLPHPPWFAVASLLVIPAAFSGARLSARA